MIKRIFYIVLVAALALIPTACNRGGDENLDREESLKLLDAKIKKDGENADLYYQRGRVLVSLGKEKNNTHYFIEAIADLDKAIELDDSKPEYYTALGDAYFANGDAGKSYNALQNALRLDEDNFEASLKMGEIAFYSKDYDRAMESLNVVTSQDKDNQTALFMKGFIYKETGDTSNAVYYFRRLIDLYPEYEPAYEELGVLYAQHQDPLAVEYLNTVLNMDPQNQNALYAMAMFYQDIEDMERANALYVKLLEINPQHKYAWHNRGWIEMMYYDDYDAAVELFAKAIDCDNSYGEAHYDRGVAYELMGDKAKAEECFKAAAEVGYVPESTKKSK